MLMTIVCSNLWGGMFHPKSHVCLEAAAHTDLCQSCEAYIDSSWDAELVEYKAPQYTVSEYANTGRGNHWQQVGSQQIP